MATKTSKSTPIYVAPKPEAQLGFPGMEDPIKTVEEKRNPWPDVSMYKLHFGFVKLLNGEERLVMVDEEGAWADRAPDWGFQPSRFVGLWFSKSSKFKIYNFKILFPLAVVKML